MKLLVSLASVLLAGGPFSGGTAAAVPAVHSELTPPIQYTATLPPSHTNQRQLQQAAAGACASDITQDGLVSTEDLLALLASFGRDASDCDQQTDCANTNPDGASLEAVQKHAGPLSPLQITSTFSHTNHSIFLCNTYHCIQIRGRPRHGVGLSLCLVGAMEGQRH